MQSKLDEIFGDLKQYKLCDTTFVYTDDVEGKVITPVREFVNGELIEDGQAINPCESFEEALQKTQDAISIIVTNYKNIWVRIMPEYTYDIENYGHYIRVRLAYCNDKEDVCKT